MNPIKRFLGAREPISIKILPIDLTFTTTGKQTILKTAIEQKITYPHGCRVGSCGACKSRLLEGRVRELTDKSYTLTAAEIAAGYILACQSVPKTDLVLEVLGLDEAARRTRPAPLDP